MSEADAESPLGGDEDVFEPEQESNLIENDEETNVEVHESKEEVLRRKKIRRQLELRLERKRLREELDDFIDLNDEDDEDVLDDDSSDDDGNNDK